MQMLLDRRKRKLLELPIDPFPAPFFFFLFLFRISIGPLFFFCLARVAQQKTEGRLLNPSVHRFTFFWMGKEIGPLSRQSPCSSLQDWGFFVSTDFSPVQGFPRFFSFSSRETRG
jgi:hypothetical protein